MNEDPEGRAKGGVARATALSPIERSEIAKRAAEARWDGETVEATHGSPDHPMKIGDIEIPCYVLADERRVLTMKGMLTSLAMSKGGPGRWGAIAGDRLTRFALGKAINPYINNDLLRGIQSPIRFRTPGRGGKSGISYGYEATLLADMCEAVLEARRCGALQDRQLHIAQQCEILVRGFARVGIIALVDEATGFQHDRARDALAKILEAFVAKELQPYIRTFPSDYYEQMFRLRGLEYPKDSVKRPQYFGMLTNDLVYKRLAPGVLHELKRVTPKSESGKPKHKLFQWLTANVGYPKLREHLGSLVAIMKLSNQWPDFMENVNRLHPPYGQTLQLPFPPPHDDGKGL